MENFYHGTTRSQDKADKGQPVKWDAGTATDHHGGEISYDVGLSSRPGLKHEAKVIS